MLACAECLLCAFIVSVSFNLLLLMLLIFDVYINTIQIFLIVCYVYAHTHARRQTDRNNRRFFLTLNVFDVFELNVISINITYYIKKNANCGCCCVSNFG